MECTFSPSRSLYYFSKILPFKGECPFSSSKSSFRTSGKPPTPGNAHYPCLEIPSTPCEIPSSGNAPPPTQKFLPFLRATTPQGMPLLPAKKCLSLLKGATPWGMPLFPLKSSFHFSGEPFHGECPFSLREPLHGNPRPYPSKCISFMLRGASASWAYRSLQVKNIFMGESNMWVSLKVFHVSSRYLCFLRLTWGD
jgi:hypothetical protein